MFKRLFIVVGLVLAIGSVFYWLEVRGITSLTRVGNQPNVITDTTISPLTDIPANALRYKIDSGTVSYIAIKKAFGSGESEVIGSTTDVRGQGWFDPSENTAYLDAVVDVSTLKTDDPKRDISVQVLLPDKVARIVVSLDNTTQVNFTEFFETTVIGDLTIAGVTRPQEFRISGLISEGDFNISGNTSILLTDFDIKVPEVPGVMTVDDSLQINFEITGSRAADQ
jgi:polyisoprenoid-binding protein YceI